MWRMSPRCKECLQDDSTWFSNIFLVCLSPSERKALRSPAEGLWPVLVAAAVESSLTCERRAGLGASCSSYLLSFVAFLPAGAPEHPTERSVWVGGVMWSLRGHAVFLLELLAFSEHSRKGDCASKWLRTHKVCLLVP